MSVRLAKLHTGQQGVALVTVMLIIAILTAIVSRMSLSNVVWQRQVENGGALVQAMQGTRAAQVWVGRILEEDKNAYDASTDIWAQPMPPMPVAWGHLYGWVDDMQGRFNLNNLVDNEGNLNGVAMQQFEQLLSSLDLHPGIAQAAADWIDINGATAGPWGAEDIYYLGLDFPYHAANRPFDDGRELRLVRGVDSDAWLKLEPFVAALPAATKLNVNTARPEVLAAVLSGWNLTEEVVTRAMKWSNDPDREPVRDLETFAVDILGARQSPALSSLSISTEYFLVHTQLSFDTVEYRMATLYQRRSGRAGIIRQSREIY